MLAHNHINLSKVYNERVRSNLSAGESAAMEKAISHHPIQRLYTKVAGKVYWYLLNAPSSLRGKCYGTANSEDEADRVISGLLETVGKNKNAVLV